MPGLFETLTWDRHRVTSAPSYSESWASPDSMWEGTQGSGFWEAQSLKAVSGDWRIRVTPGGCFTQ